jgi:hypothetical protein
VAHNLCTTLDFTVSVVVILGNGERTTSSGFPQVLFVIVVLGYDLNLISDEVSGVETEEGSNTDRKKSSSRR